MTAAPTPPAPARSTGDVLASVVLWAASLLMLFAGGAVGLFFLMFIDYCPPATCSVDGAVTAVFSGLAAALAALVTSVVIGSLRLARRRRAWPFALAGLGAVVLLFAAGLGAGFAAVGW